ncbi:alpha/beta hydrolase [Mucilaginibacter robiniae]|uniref:Alpha/beta hydrolase n=1 Tax=Mucilaginibacter robiniae TaxID=2728022 RepID=A0A7L5E9L7_9SPHI|nr:alpha/beta hydrolase [Mucilaginibacter robiniae]QJD97076.1 alpha/beta hydrolase [Mucilaginibacter robiniae]
MSFLQLPGLGRVRYYEYGTGTKPLLAFHGYGMTGEQFKVLEKSILTQYKVYSFDHFFHGETELQGWDEARILAGMSKPLMRQYLEAWFEKFGQQRISLMGYSMGAKLALVLVEQFPDLIDQLVLIAPDGLSVYKGFNFLVHKPFGKYLFKTAVKSNWLAPGILKTLKKVRFIDESLYKIAYHEMDTSTNRHNVYYTLHMLKLLKVEPANIAGVINQHHIQCTFVFGKHDMLFPKTGAMSFINLLNNPEVHELPMGHWLVTPQLDDYLVNCLV